MSLCCKCRNTSQFLVSISSNLSTNRKFNPVWIPFRPIFKGLFKDPDKINRNREKYQKPYVKDIDDPNFTKLVWEHGFDLNLHKEGIRNIIAEFKKLGKEGTDFFRDIGRYRVDKLDNKVEILQKFETPEDIENFSVQSDSNFNSGYSSVSLKITENESGLFSGYINKEIPKTGNIKVAGWANFTCPKQYKSFYRVKSYDWSKYNNLVFKVRGDGRTYLLLLQTDVFLEDSCYILGQQLFTRGGPYWEIIEVPLSYFFILHKGKIQPNQTGGSEVFRNHITTLGITAGGFEGPFKLEIDYIGLVFKPYQKSECPFEQYKAIK